MTSLKLGTLPALRRQNLFAEFAGLKQACPDGVFVSLTPGDPMLWSGVIFVRKGPYATAILRFQISFPDSYPSLPPLVTFSSDIFHPLITPLTTYTYTTDIHDTGTVSATDDERLPPGGFSLRHGFPGWFGRSRAAAAAATRAVSGGSSATAGTARTPPPPKSSSGITPTPPSSSSKQLTPGSGSMPAYMLSTTTTSSSGSNGSGGGTSTYDVLRYIASAFDDEAVLDAVPLEAAGNPGAWHAWRAKRVITATTAVHGGQGQGQGQGLPGAAAAASSVPPPPPPRSPPPPQPAVSEGGGGPRRPGEWNWEGVWEERVRRGIAASLSEGVLFGNAGAADDVIRFLNMERADVDSVKENLIKTLGPST